MRTSRIWGLSLFVLTALSLAVGQQQGQQQGPQSQARKVSRVYFVTPKAGMELEFEKATKGHMEFHRQKKDTWTWHARYTETGNRTGEYLFVTSDHDWKDFDNPVVSGQDDGTDYLTNVARFVDRVRSILMESRPDLSRGAMSEPPPPLATVTYFHVKYGQGLKFEEAVKQINQALDKSNAPRQGAWYQLVASGRNTTYILTWARANWADFAPPDGPGLQARVEQAIGKEKADALMQMFRDSVEFTESKITAARPDLSYTPAAK